MTEFQNPALGTTVSILSALVSWGVTVALSTALRRHLRLGAGSAWFALHGVLTSCAILSAFSGLALGDVSLVSPLIASQPFMVLVLSHISFVRSRP